MSFSETGRSVGVAAVASDAPITLPRAMPPPGEAERVHLLPVVPSATRRRDPGQRLRISPCGVFFQRWSRPIDGEARPQPAASRDDG
jgi:hypothetical protein